MISSSFGRCEATVWHWLAPTIPLICSSRCLTRHERGRFTASRAANGERSSTLSPPILCQLFGSSLNRRRILLNFVWRTVPGGALGCGLALAIKGGCSMLKNALAFALILLISTTTAMAQQRAVARACAADIKAQCAGVQPGEGRIKACVRDHFGDLSASCQGLLVKAAAVGEGLRRRRQAKLRWHKAGWRSDRGLRKVSFRRFQRCLQGCGDAGRSGQDLKAKLMPCRLGDAVRRTPAARSTKLTRSQRGHTKEDGFCRRSISGDRHTDAGYWSPFMVKCSAVVEAA